VGHFPASRLPAGASLNREWGRFHCYPTYSETHWRGALGSGNVELSTNLRLAPSEERSGIVFRVRGDNIPGGLTVSRLEHGVRSGEYRVADDGTFEVELEETPGLKKRYSGRISPRGVLRVTRVTTMKSGQILSTRGLSGYGRLVAVSSTVRLDLPDRLSAREGIRLTYPVPLACPEGADWELTVVGIPGARLSHGILHVTLPLGLVPYQTGVFTLRSAGQVVTKTMTVAVLSNRHGFRHGLLVPTVDLAGDVLLTLVSPSGEGEKHVARFHLTGLNPGALHLTVRFAGEEVSGNVGVDGSFRLGRGGALVVGALEADRGILVTEASAALSRLDPIGVYTGTLK
jgi:hypothetical protein